MNIDAKIEYWKKSLLDLGKRNRLISCPLPKTGGRISRFALLIKQPDYSQLWSLFAENGGCLEFPIPPQNEENFEAELSDGTLPLIFDKNNKVFNNGTETNQTLKEAHKTLRSLMKKAKEFSDEKGLNALYLAFGFLNWKENGEDGREMRSPLVLVPVKLEQEDLFSSIILSSSDEEITANSSLMEKLQRDFGVELPDFNENLAEYLSKVEKIVKPLGWNVSTDITQLSLFSFMKINMYRDLERNAEKIAAHSIVRALNGETTQGNTDLSDIKDYNHDNTEPQEVFSILDADSSQQDAILLAKRGVSFVLQGPPGTGKSQTITNIIAELIANNKKVLFVSEKMAALDVVHKRLTQKGLADFCLTLHSHNAKRREILYQFQCSLKKSRERVQIQQDAFDKLYRLKDTRSTLNNYSKELHTIVEPFGKTIYQVNGFLAQLENYPNIDYIQANVKNFTPTLFSQCEIALEELTRVVAKSGYQKQNPWNGCLLPQITHEFRQQFIVESDEFKKKLKEVLSVFAQTNILLDTKCDLKFSMLEEMQKLYDFTKTSPQVPSLWLSLDLARIINNLNNCIRAVELQKKSVELQEDLNSITASFDNEHEKEKISKKHLNISYSDLIEFQDSIITGLKYILDEEKVKENNATEKYEIEFNDLVADNYEDILSVDAETYLSLYRDKYRTFLRGFFAGYREAHKELSKYRKTFDKVPYADELILLDKITTVKQLKFKMDEQSKVVKKYEQLLADTEVLFDSCKPSFLSQNFDENCAKIITFLGFEFNTEIDFNTLKPTENKFSYNEELNLITKIASVRQLANEAKKQSKIVADIKSQLNQTQSDFDSCTRELNNLCFENICKETGALLEIELKQDSNFENLKAKIKWSEQFCIFVKQFNLGQEYIDKVCKAEKDIFEQTNFNIAELYNCKKQCEPYIARFLDLFDEQRKEKLCEISLDKLNEQLCLCSDNFAALEYLIDYRNAVKSIEKVGIGDYLNKAKSIDLDAAKIIPVFKKCFFRSWLDAVIPNFETLSEFRRLRQDERIKLFKDLDKTHLEISNAMLVSKLVSQLPNLDGFSSSGEIALLNREMAKQRKLMPIRKLIAELPNLLPQLKPCVMMSPLSVSTYLGESNFEFDAVIFDEASQVRTEDGIGAIFRGKQIIIAGDSKQLPPTDFFNSSISSLDEFEEDEDGEIDDTGAYESLLDEASLLPTQTLLWHYRSRHEHLIAFSNVKIYQGSLITFPSSVEKSSGMGVEYVHVAGGTYNRGGKNGNRAEAEKVAHLVFEHFLHYPNRSLGIIAFGGVQQMAIEEAINEKRRANPTFESFFKEDKEESLFIKNLETVQGDERDTIIFSIGYAPDEAGKFIMNFGPLSRSGGERRLNVAITRARYNLKLVGSILPTDIDTERTSGEGPKLLRLYIDFAINGVTAILGEVSTNSELWFDSPFETSVYNFLTQNGFNVATQVGCSGYRIDMAIWHPQYKGRFAIGIECDGAAYHSARTARERDRLRQTVLEDMGWEIYRVWSTDWIKDCKIEGERLLTAVKDAIENYHEIKPVALKSACESADDFLEIKTVSFVENYKEGIREKHKAIRSNYYGCNTEEVPLSDFRETMLKVLSVNFGINKEELFKETANYGYGWQRQGDKIKYYFTNTFKNLVDDKIIETDADGKIKLINSLKTKNQ